MRTIIFSAAAVMLSATAAFASPKTYQVTGPVLEINSKAIMVAKGNEKWEIQRDAASSVPADVKVGSKVTVEYTMTAVTVTPKDAAAKTAGAKDKK